MTIMQIETNIIKLLKNFSQDGFIFEFLLAYGKLKAVAYKFDKAREQKFVCCGLKQSQVR